MQYPIRFLLLAILLLGCQKAPKSGKSLNVYIETPALYHALTTYQREVDSEPLSVHLRYGLDLFFQLSGGERPIEKQRTEEIKTARVNTEQGKLDENIPRLVLGGGLFLSSELAQMAELKAYLEKLHEDPVADLFQSEYLTPILLYPKLSQITGLSQITSLPQNLETPSLYRLLSPTWLETQLLKRDDPVFLQSPSQALLGYLKASPVEFSFSQNGFTATIPKQYRQFIQDYRELLKQEENATTELKLHAAGSTLARQLQELYPPQDRKLAHRDPDTRLEASTFTDLYFTGQFQNSSSKNEKQNLQLQLEKILWGGVSKGLSQEQREQALRLLTWLRSRDGQATLQRELAQVNRNTSLGIYPEVNFDFWENLQLDWPWIFNISWVLAEPLIKWQPELFQSLSFEEEQLYRSQSALSVAYDFLLPYLFLSKDQGEAPQQVSLDWSLWLNQP